MWPIREFQSTREVGEVISNSRMATHKLAGDNASPRKEQRRRVVISPLSVAILPPCSIAFPVVD